MKAEMHIQVEVVTRRDIVISALTATEALIDLVHRHMNKDERIDDSRAVNRRK